MGRMGAEREMFERMKERVESKDVDLKHHMQSKLFLSHRINALDKNLKCNI